MAAQGWIDERPVGPGPVRSSPAIERVGSTVRVTVDGRIARFEVEERFRNTGRGIAEGTYHYPMPGEALFTDFSLFQGEKELKGEMMAADQARGIYEGIVRQLKDPALITLVGHGLIRAQVFPIQPGETRTVILRYNQLLSRDGDALHLRYAAGLRGDAPVAVRFDVVREAEYATPYSPTHALTPRPRGSPSPVGWPTPPLIDFASRNSASWSATGKSSMGRSPPQNSTLSRTRSQPHDAPPGPDRLARERPIPVTKLPRERHLRYRHAHRVGPQRARSLDGTPKAGRPRRGPNRANGRDRSSLARWSSPSPLGPSSRQLPT